MDFENRREVVGVFGVSGSGKTTFALRLLVGREYVARFVFDWDGQVAARLALPPAHSRSDCETALATGFVLFDPNREWPGRHSEAFSWFCGWAFEASGRGPGRKILVVDEVWRYLDNWRIPEPLQACVQTGRVRGLDLLFATQRPNRLNETLSGELTESVCFRIGGERSLKVLEGLGFETEEVSSLPLGAFVSVDADGHELRGRLF